MRLLQKRRRTIRHLINVVSYASLEIKTDRGKPVSTTLVNANRRPWKLHVPAPVYYALGIFVVLWWSAQAYKHLADLTFGLLLFPLYVPLRLLVAVFEPGWLETFALVWLTLRNWQ